MKHRNENARWFGLSRGCAWIGFVISGLGIWGCPAGTVPGDGQPSNYVDGNFDTTVTSPLGKTSGEPDDSFNNAIVGVPESSGLIRLKGTVSTGSDLDVFRIGRLSPGDRVVVDTLAVTSLDVSIALFDADGRLVSDNDDRSNQNLDSHIDFTARHDDDPYYLVVTRSAFAQGVNRRTGAYTAQVEFQRGNSAPQPAPQTLFLQFGGGTYNSPQMGPIDLGPFDGGAIDSVYSDNTNEIKQTILEVIRQNYERFNVTVESSDEFTPDAQCDYSTIYFGAFRDDAFGIADNVDLYNADFCDDAIIYTESFTPDLFSSTPTAEELGIAIGNVAAHEAGHLLGLNHVDDDLDLMDDRSGADVFLIDQEFKNSILSSDIMPIGTQDGVLLLDETVGPANGGSGKFVDQGKRGPQYKTGAIGGVEMIKRRSR